MQEASTARPDKEHHRLLGERRQVSAESRNKTDPDEDLAKQKIAAVSCITGISKAKAGSRRNRCWDKPHAHGCCQGCVSTAHHVPPAAPRAPKPSACCKRQVASPRTLCQPGASLLQLSPPAMPHIQHQHPHLPSQVVRSHAAHKTIAIPPQGFGTNEQSHGSSLPAFGPTAPTLLPAPKALGLIPATSSNLAQRSVQQ